MRVVVAACVVAATVAGAVTALNKLYPQWRPEPSAGIARVVVKSSMPLAEPSKAAERETMAVRPSVVAEANKAMPPQPVEQAMLASKPGEDTAPKPDGGETQVASAGDGLNEEDVSRLALDGRLWTGKIVHSRLRQVCWTKPLTRTAAPLRRKCLLEGERHRFLLTRLQLCRTRMRMLIPQTRTAMQTVLPPRTRRGRVR